MSWEGLKFALARTTKKWLSWDLNLDLTLGPVPLATMLSRPREWGLGFC